MDIQQTTQTTAVSKFLMFSLGSIDFAVRLSEVSEIIRLAPIRKIPRVPPFIQGVVHMRGGIIIIVNLRVLLQIGGRQKEKSKIIIFPMFGRQIGFIVDDVSRIIQRPPDEILAPPPVIMQGLDPECIKGVLKEGERNILIIDLKKSLSTFEEDSLNQVLERELTFLINQLNE